MIVLLPFAFNLVFYGSVPMKWRNFISDYIFFLNFFTLIGFTFRSKVKHKRIKLWMRLYKNWEKIPEIPWNFKKQLLFQAFFKTIKNPEFQGIIPTVDQIFTRQITCFKANFKPNWANFYWKKKMKNVQKITYIKKIRETR